MVQYIDLIEGIVHQVEIYSYIIVHGAACIKPRITSLLSISSPQQQLICWLSLSWIKWPTRRIFYLILGQKVSLFLKMLSFAYCSPTVEKLFTVTAASFIHSQSTNWLWIFFSPWPSEDLPRVAFNQVLHFISFSDQINLFVHIFEA